MHTQTMSLINDVLTAVHPAHLIPQFMQRHGRQLTIGPVQHHLDHGRLFLVSAGKAAVPMTHTALNILGDAVSAAVIISKQRPTDYRSPITNYQFFAGDHPVSGANSVRATTAVTNLLRDTRPHDLLLCLLSGGASALLTQPLIPLAEWQALNRALLASGCTIQEFNTVRRQLDQVKGGGLARLAAPAQVVSLILSDVVGDDLAAIGSGPTVLVEETAQDALAVLKNYELGIRNYEGGTAVFDHVYAVLTRNPATPHTSRLADHRLPITAHQFPPPTNLLIGGVRQAADAARQSAETLGFTARILTAHLEGEAREAGKFAAAIAKELPPGHCAILGGETTVTVRGDGRGGRNLELALSAAIALDGWPDVSLTAFATDGDDAMTRAAGATVTGQTVPDGKTIGLNARQFLDNNDSLTYFQKLDATGAGPHLLITGPTGTNVNDLIFIIHNS